MKRPFIAVLFVIILTSPSYPGQRLNIFYQNDLHGWFFPSAQEAGLPKVLEILKEENQKGLLNFYVVAGDIVTGPRLPEDKKGRVELEVWGLYQGELDQIGFRGRHILSLGNHEFDHGFPEILKELNPICANIVNEKNEPYFRPFTIAKERDISVSFLGLIMDDYPKVNGVLKEKGLRVEDLKGSIKKYEPFICRADITVLVIHDNISDIKELVEGLSDDSCIDVVITGHTHITTETPIYMKGKPIVQAGSMNQFLGKLELEYEEGKVKVVQNQLIPLFPDKFTYELMNFKEMVSEQKGNSIALVRSSLHKPKGKIPNEGTLGSFIADAIRWKSKTDIAIINNDSLRKEFHVRYGPLPLREGDIKEMYPYKNKIVTGFVKGGDLLRFVQGEIEDFKNQISGFSYTLKMGEKTVLESIKVGEREIDLSRNYSISLPSVLVKSENVAGLLHNLPISSIKETPYTISESAIEFARRMKLIDYGEGTKRIIVRR